MRPISAGLLAQEGEPGDAGRGFDAASVAAGVALLRGLLAPEPAPRAHLERFETGFRDAWRSHGGPVEARGLRAHLGFVAALCGTQAQRDWLARIGRVVSEIVDAEP